MNRIDRAFNEKGGKLLNVYFTVGFPRLEDTLRIATALEQAGADMLELGMPYSDPIADGPTIQESSAKAIQNGMTLEVLFDQLKGLRQQVSIPVLLMGYLNPVMQFGLERFCEKCKETGIDGLILPDLPLQEYQEMYKPLFDQYGLYNIFLITPQTSELRVRRIDELSGGFIYMVSSASITGARQGISDIQKTYFERIQSYQLKARRMIGFGISDHESFETACQFAEGAIIGSAFIKQLEQDSSDASIQSFIQSIKPNKS